MKTVEHEGVQYQLPESLWEMTVGQYIDLTSAIEQPHDSDDLGYNIGLIHILSGVPVEVLEAMDFAHFDRLAGLCTFDDLSLPDSVTAEEAGVKTTKEPIRFDVDGRSFLFNPDYAFNTIGRASRIEDLLKGQPLMKNLHVILALCAWQEGEVFDLEAIREKARLMTRAKMSDVMRPLLFFWRDAPRSTGLFRVCGKLASKEGRKAKPTA